MSSEKTSQKSKQKKSEKSKKESSSFIQFQTNPKATFRPLKKHKNPRWAALENHKMETLGFGNMREAVQLPEGEDLNEWLAVNVVDFYNQLSMLYATITEFCTNETCPVMSAGDFKFYWSDGNKYPKPVSVSAPVYIGLLFDWVDEQLTNESIFPSMIGVPFPKNFEQIVKNIMRRLFRVYAHCFHSHLENFTELDTLRHLNTSFKQFIFFTKEFNLIASDQLEPLKPIITEILKT